MSNQKVIDPIDHVEISLTDRNGVERIVIIEPNAPLHDLYKQLLQTPPIKENRATRRQQKRK